jgi:putative transposase
MNTPRKRYPSDLSDAEWTLLEPLVPAVKPGGRPAHWSRREIVNGIFYARRAGGPWRALPHDLPPWQTVYGYSWRWRNAGTWETINTALRERVRRAAGRQSSPQVALVDSQSVKTTQQGGRAASTRASR